MVQRRALNELSAAAFSLLGAAAPHELSARDIDRAEIWRGAVYRRAELGPLDTPGAAGKGGAGGLFRAHGIELASWLPLDALKSGAGSASGLALTRTPTGRLYAFVGLSNGLACVEVTQPDAARLAHAAELPPSTARAFVAASGVLYTLDARGVLRLFGTSELDAGRAERLAELDTGHATSPSLAVDASRARLYVAAGRGGLATYDVAAPRAPKLLARWNERYVDSLVLAPDGSARVACADGFNDGWTRAGVELLDLADPAAPRALGRLEWSEGIPHVVAWDRAGRRILALHERDAARLGERESRLAILELDQGGRLARAPGEAASIGVAQHLAASDERVALAGCRRGLRLLDPATGLESAWFDTVPTDDALRFSGLWDVAFVDARTLVGVDLEKGLFVWSLAAAPASASKPSTGH